MNEHTTTLDTFIQRERIQAGADGWEDDNPIHPGIALGFQTELILEHISRTLAEVPDRLVLTRMTTSFRDHIPADSLVTAHLDHVEREDYHISVKSTLYRNEQAALESTFHYQPAHSLTLHPTPGTPFLLKERRARLVGSSIGKDHADHPSLALGIASKLLREDYAEIIQKHEAEGSVPVYLKHDLAMNPEFHQLRANRAIAVSIGTPRERRGIYTFPVQASKSGIGLYQGKLTLAFIPQEKLRPQDI